MFFSYPRHDQTPPIERLSTVVSHSTKDNFVQGAKRSVADYPKFNNHTKWNQCNRAMITRAEGSDKVFFSEAFVDLANYDISKGREKHRCKRPYTRTTTTTSPYITSLLFTFFAWIAAGQYINNTTRRVVDIHCLGGLLVAISAFLLGGHFLVSRTT